MTEIIHRQRNWQLTAQDLPSTVAEHPTYRYDPKFHFKGVKTQHLFTISPGHNNPVGMVWIDLSKPSYGIDGTPDPAKIGKTQSDGCIRLTNWDALDLAAYARACRWRSWTGDRRRRTEDEKGRPGGKNKQIW